MFWKNKINKRVSNQNCRNLSNIKYIFIMSVIQKVQKKKKAEIYLNIIMKLPSLAISNTIEQTNSKKNNDCYKVLVKEISNGKFETKRKKFDLKKFSDDSVSNGINAQF